MNSQDLFDPYNALFQALLDQGVGIVLACRGNASQFTRPSAGVMDYIPSTARTVSYQVVLGKHLQDISYALSLKSTLRTHPILQLVYSCVNQGHAIFRETGAQLLHQGQKVGICFGRSLWPWIAGGVAFVALPEFENVFMAHVLCASKLQVSVVQKIPDPIALVDVFG